MAEQDPNTMVHTHVDENGNVITHCHGGEGHTHAHPHTHTQTKAVINRLARAIGHLESVKRMVEDGRDCAEVLIQLAAVRSALNNTAKIILKDHIDHCLADAVETGDQQERTQVVMVGESGQTVFEARYSSAVRSLSAAGDHIAILLRDSLVCTSIIPGASARQVQEITASSGCT